MGLYAQKKKEFIRWYAGHFVYDPQSEIYNFGLVRPYRAQQLTSAIRFVSNNQGWLIGIPIGFLLGVILFS